MQPLVNTLFWGVDNVFSFCLRDVRCICSFTCLHLVQRFRHTIRQSLSFFFVNLSVRLWLFWRLGIIFTICSFLRMRNSLAFRIFFVSYACAHLRAQWMLLRASHWKFLSKYFGVFGNFHCLLGFCNIECFCPVISARHFGNPVAFWCFHTY